MEVSEGIEHQAGKVYKLLNKKFTKTLKSLGFKPTITNTSIFIHPHSIIVTIYVNNVIFFAKDLKEIKYVKEDIKKIYTIKDLESILKILGIHMIVQTNGSIKID